MIMKLMASELSQVLPLISQLAADSFPLHLKVFRFAPGEAFLEQFSTLSENQV